MSSRFILFLVSVVVLALPPDFSANYRFTNRPGEPTDGVTVYNGATSTLPINNSAIGCVGFSFTYNSEGFSVISINLQTSPKFLGGQASGTWSTFGGTATTGTLPMSGTSQGTYIGYGYYPFIRINLATATGTGSVDVQFQCWKSISYASTLGGGGGGGSIIAGNGINITGGNEISIDPNVTSTFPVVQQGTATYCNSTTGNTSYTCVLNPVSSGAYIAPSCLILITDTSNVTTATLNVDTRGPLSILNSTGSALSANNITANIPVNICLNSADSAWIIQGGSSSCTIFGNTITAPVIGNWTALGTGGNRNNITYPCGGGAAIEMIGTVGTSNLYGVQIAVSGNYTHTLILDAAVPQVQFSNLNIGFTDGTISEGCGPAYNGAFILTGNLIPTLASGGGPANGLQSDFSPSSPNFPYLPTFPLIIQLNKTGSVLTCSISLNRGASFKSVFVDSTPALTPTDIFIGMTPSSGTPTIRIQATLISYN